MRRRFMTAALTISAVTLSARPASAHPLHSTITELSEDRASGVVRATIRVFADDFGTAVARARKGVLPTTAGPQWDATALAYVATTFAFVDPAGRVLSMRSCGTKRTSDLLWICVEAVSPGGLAGLGVNNRMLSDLFDDQVNVVQASVGGARRSLLFTKGDRAKAIGG